MSVVSQILGVAVNLLVTPFAIPSPYPPNCNSLLFKMGENELKVSLIPKGYCPNCCPIRRGIDVRYVLYNKANPVAGTPIHIQEPGAARQAGVNPNWPTVIFLHGFTEPSPGQSGRAVADAYLGRPEDYNVILVDWSEMGTFPWYRPAVKNVKYVAETLKNFLEVFNDSGEIPMGTVHLIGFSLGGHVAGFAGKRLRRDLRIPRITALDPAFPEYSLKDASRRLTNTDADYVDVIHTDAGVFGMPIPVGHADFYPNEGKALQPGCQPSYLAQFQILDQIFGCSHVRAWRYYAESVRNPVAFPATACTNWRGPNSKCNFTEDAMMGYRSNLNATRGQFYLVTGYRAPFAKTVHQQIYN